MPSRRSDFLRAAGDWPVDRAAEVCGLGEDDIRTLADWWGSTRRSMLRIGWGQERNSNGGAACRAILALPVLAGHFGVPGAGVIGSTSPGAVRTRRRWPAFERLDRRSLPLHQIGEWMRPGSPDPCRVLFVQGANPALMCPDQRAVDAALGRDDVFTIVHEQVLTDTTRFADVVLPATTSFEIDDVAMSYGSLMVQPVASVIPPVGESRSNDQVGLALARAFGLDWEMAGLDPRHRRPRTAPRRLRPRGSSSTPSRPPTVSAAGLGWSTRSTACLPTSPSNDARRAASH